MRGARITLVVCLAVGLAAVWYAAEGHLRELRLSVEKAEVRALRAELKERARDLAEDLAERIRQAPVTATYDADGRLLRPSPPREARRFWNVLISRTADLDEIIRRSPGSPGRAHALLRKGYAERDAELLEEALTEPALAGTEMAYRVRQEIFDIRGRRPDVEWVDDVSALLGGRSDGLARILLAGAGLQPLDTARQRRELAALRPEPGYTFVGPFLQFVEREREERLLLRRVALASLHAGEGPYEAPLPEPFERIRVRADIDQAAVARAVEEERLEIAGLYALASLILVIGTVYAYIAIGRAYRLASEKNDFIANVTHELKTPLANIRLFGESLRDGRVRDEDRAEFLATILDEAGRLDSLVEGLLYAARGPGLDLKSLEPGTLIAEAEARWRPRLEQEGFAFQVDAPELPAIRGDREALLRAVDNLLDNARKYAGEDKRIELGGAAVNGTVRLTVRDHGPGIPAQDRRRVLRPFSRLESADRKETPGTGLGLSLVLSCLDAHGGRLEIAEARDGGAEITLILPLAKDQ